MPRSYQAQWVVGMAVKQGRTDLMLRLNQALEDLKASGELTNLFKKYNISYTKP